jgi:hypothetical protein
MVESRFDGERQIRGKTDPQRVYRLEAIHQHAGRFDAALRRGLTTFVGRDVELEALERSLADIGTGVRVWDVVGEPGIGKSRLLLNSAGASANRARSSSREAVRRTDNRRPSCHSSTWCRDLSASLQERLKRWWRESGDGLGILGTSSAQNLALLLNLLSLTATRRLAGPRQHSHRPTPRDLLLMLVNARCRLSSVLMIVESALDGQRIGGAVCQDDRRYRPVAIDGRPYAPA